MNNKTTIQNIPSNGKFHRVEQIVPWGGTKCSIGWNKVFHGVEHLHTLYLLLLMLVLGSGNAWGQTDPVEITTEEEDNNNTEKLYLIQTNQFQSFYMIPKGTNVSTVNLPNEQMLWYFKNAGKDNGTQYYYIVNKFNSLYICHGGGTTDNTTSRGVTLVEKTQSNEERCKFKIVEDNTNDTEGFYNINTKANVTYFALNKQSGSVSSENNIRLTNTKYAHDLNSKWKFIRFNGTVTWSAPPFTPSTDTEKYFYKINSKINTSYNISSNYPTTDNKVTFASTSSDNMVWYFKEVPSELVGESSSWYKYYYIVNQNSDGQYMYYDGIATDGSGQTDAVSLKEKSEVNEDRYQFVIVQAAKTDKSDKPMECYMIVPKLLRGNLWNSNSIGPDAESNGNFMDIIEGRASLKETTNNYAHVTFTLIEPCAEPTISLDPSTNKVIISTTESASSLYYTITDGIVDAETLASPTRANTQYTSPITLTSTKTIKAVTIKNNYSKAKSNPVTKTIVYNPTITFSGGPWTYDKTAKEPSISSVMVGETSIPSTDYDITYANNVNAGTTASVTIRESSTSEYLIYGTQNFTISQAPLSVTANNHSITYGDEPANNGVTYNGFVGGEDKNDLSGTLSYDYNYNQYDNVGDNYTITPTGLTSNNYTITPVAGTLTVTPKEVGIDWTNTELTYNHDEQHPTATATDLVNGDEIGVTVTGGQTNAGINYIATASALTGTKAGNYKLPAAKTQTFSITKVPLTVTAKDYSITYGDEPINDGVEYDGFVGGETSSVLNVDALDYEYSYTRYSDVGNTYTITPKGITSSNYEISYASGTLTVNQKEVGLSWSETTTFPYDGNSHILTATATGLVNNDVISVTVTGEQTNVGDHTATASALTGTKKDNYTLPTSNTHAFSITKVPLTVTANNHSITYGDALTGGNGVTYSGFVGGQDESVLGGTLGYDYSYTLYGDVGNTYTITPKGITSSNYEISYASGTLTVTPKEVGIDWTNTEFTYNGSEQAPTATATGLVNGDVIAVTVTGAQINAGNDYIATASALDGTKTGNYLLPEGLTQTFIILPKSIGDGNKAADGISIVLSSNGTLTAVKDGSTTLEEDNDYTYTTETVAADKVFIITGIGNYTGSAKGIYANAIFKKPDEEGSGQAAAVYKASSDLEAPTGIKPYIVRKVNPSIGTLVISEIAYIPADVPVLLLSDEELSGFTASPKPDNISEITAGQKNSNQLKESYEGLSVEAAQIYMFFNGEFVLTKAGTFKGGGKFFIYNPNYAAEPRPVEDIEEPNDPESRGSLQIVVEDWDDSDETTEVEPLSISPEGERTEAFSREGLDGVWYDFNGRRVAQPVKGGIYIYKGQKVYIKKK